MGAQGVLSHVELGKKCCCSPGSLQREINQALNRYTWWTWREGEGNKSQSKGLSVAGESELRYGPHNLEWALGEGWTRAMELDEGHDFFHKSGRRIGKDSCQTEWRVCLGESVWMNLRGRNMFELCYCGNQGLVSLAICPKIPPHQN